MALERVNTRECLHHLKAIKGSPTHLEEEGWGEGYSVGYNFCSIGAQGNTIVWTNEKTVSKPVWGFFLSHQMSNKDFFFPKA